MLLLLGFKSCFQSMLISHLRLPTSIDITVFCRYVLSRQLLICLIDVELFSLLSYFPLYRVLLNVGDCQEFLLVQYKGEVRIKGLTCKEELQHSEKVLPER